MISEGIEAEIKQLLEAAERIGEAVAAGAARRGIRKPAASSDQATNASA